MIQYHSNDMGDEGLEHFPKSFAKSHDSGPGGAKSGALGAQTPDSADVPTSPAAPVQPGIPGSPFHSVVSDASDGDLALIVARWPELPSAIRAGIVAMIRTVGSSVVPQRPSDPGLRGHAPVR